MELNGTHKNEIKKNNMDDKEQGSDFYAMVSRMKYITRWSLMRNSISENISEHSLEVAIIAHSLAIIGNKRLSKDLNAERAALLGIYHDSTEIITGDLPTPIKHYNMDIIDAYKEIEANAASNLLDMLPDDMRVEYEGLFFKKEEDAYLWTLVKAADKLSALIKCIEEDKAGNGEFRSAYTTIYEGLVKNEADEVGIFMEEFLGGYYKTLDELK